MVIKHTSENGVRIVLENIPAVRSVAIGIWVLAGSRHETEQNNGIAHFIEHMFFKGTKNRTAQDIAEAFDAIGGEVNAFTAKEYTCYYTRVLDTHKEYALEILADMFFNSVFSEEEIEREKQVITEEISMYDDTPDELVEDLLARAAYDTHSFGLPILGKAKNVQQFTKPMMETFLQTYYIPEHIVVSVAGNVTTDFIPTVEKHFATLTTQHAPLALSKPHFLTNKLRQAKQIEQMHVAYGFKGFKIDHAQTASVVILNNILGGNMSSRLFQDVRENKGLAYTVYSDHEAYTDHGLFTIYAATRPEQLSKLQATITAILTDLRTTGITKKELLNSQEQLKANLILNLEGTESIMARNGENELLLGDHFTIEKMISQIDAVSLASVQTVIDTVFNNKPAVALVGPY